MMMLLAAAMVAHGQVEPVGQQRVRRVAEHGAHVGGMLAAAVEVGVVTDRDRHSHEHHVGREESLLAQVVVVPERGVPAFAQKVG
jgi:hypothetical protein